MVLKKMESVSPQDHQAAAQMHAGDFGFPSSFD
jgi:hypothetical protein